MKFHHKDKVPQKATTTTLLPYFEDNIDYADIKKRSGVEVRGEFCAKQKTSLLLFSKNKKEKIYLIGLGKAQKQAAQAFESFRHFAFHQASAFAKNKTKTLCIDLRHLSAEMAYHATLGMQLAAYLPDGLKVEQNKDVAYLDKLSCYLLHRDHSAKKLIAEAQHTACTQINMMQLVDCPSNIKTPKYLAAYAKNSGKTNGFKVVILHKKQLKTKGLHATLAVGQGAAHEPVFIIMEYKPPSSKSSKKPQLGLVGKGITFDTGGVSIKPANNMHYMKSDMGGAAAVIGAIELAAKLELDIHLVAIVPTAENALDAHSIRPGDVIASYSGKSIEVINTDAEGRLVLADGLAYIQKNYKPEIVIDLATLTGSVVRTLGNAAAGLFTNNEKLSSLLQQAGTQCHERVWALPLWDDYDKEMESDVADIKNLSTRPVAGAITAAKFLQFFIAEHPAWAHLDIAGVAFGDSDYTKMKSATAYGVRLLVTFMKLLNKLN